MAFSPKPFIWLLFLMFGFMIVAGTLLADMPKDMEKIG